jgi:hypothetical protein
MSTNAIGCLGSLNWSGAARDNRFMNPENWNPPRRPENGMTLYVTAGEGDIKGGDTGLEDVALWVNFGGTIGLDEPLTLRGHVYFGDPYMRAEMLDSLRAAGKLREGSARADSIGRACVQYPAQPPRLLKFDEADVLEGV